MESSGRAFRVETIVRVPFAALTVMKAVGCPELPPTCSNRGKETLASASRWRRNCVSGCCRLGTAPTNSTDAPSRERTSERFAALPPRVRSDESARHAESSSG